MFTFFFSYNFFKDFKLSLKSDNTTFIARLITGWGWLLITSAVFVITFSIFRSLILNSIIPLEFSKIQHFTINSFIGLTSICLLIISVILLIQKVIYSIKDILNSYWQIAGLFVSLIVFLIAGFITGTGVIIMPAVFFLVIGLTGILGLRFGFTPFNYLVILVFIMGVFSTVLLISTIHNKEMENRKVVAVSLGTERDPVAEFVHNEAIGNLRYMSGYMPFTNYENKLLAYLNLPYFSRENVLAGEISNLVVGIVNFSVVLILLIMGLAVFISTRITNPLRMIQKEFSKIELGKETKPIHYEGNDEIGSLVSEYNRMVKELTRSVEMLAKSERESAWREMAKQIAHEIKNPLTPMKLSIQQLQRAWDDKSPKWEEYLNKFSNNLIEQIEHLSSIASEFSNFAEIPKSKGEVVNVITKIRKSVELFSNKGNIDFKIDLNGNNKVFIYFDKEKMVQVFSNLINNAIQSIPDDRKGEITISLDIIDEKVLVKIADNGSGIPKKIGDKLFEPNFTTKTSGMGLGLAIVKNIMEDAGGRIWYETEIGTGSTFVVEMPLYIPGKNAPVSD
ncbi:Adaptive-response sensory-kinase SasA [subsurface metagenome]